LSLVGISGAAATGPDFAALAWPAILFAGFGQWHAANIRDLAKVVRRRRARFLPKFENLLTAIPGKTAVPLGLRRAIVNYAYIC